MFWEADSFSASQEILRVLYNLKFSWHCSPQPTPCPYPDPHKSSLHSRILFL